MEISRVTIEECPYNGVYVRDGGKFDATGCQFHHNGKCGVNVDGYKVTARLTNCTSHHNKFVGMCAAFSAVIDLMGE